jgi:hypothetical protein
MSVITDIVAGLADPVADLLSEFITDKDKQAEIAYKIATMAATQAHDQAVLQLDTNRESAKHASLFVAGARPAAIWVGVAGLFLVLVFFPLVVFALAIFGLSVSPPVMDTITLFALLGPLLGLGAMRMKETLEGVERTSLGKQS